jgi:hypothetical protein
MDGAPFVIIQDVVTATVKGIQDAVTAAHRS